MEMRKETALTQVLVHWGKHPFQEKPLLLIHLIEQQERCNGLDETFSRRWNQTMVENRLTARRLRVESIRRLHNGLHMNAGALRALKYGIGVPNKDGKLACYPLTVAGMEREEANEMDDVLFFGFAFGEFATQMPGLEESLDGSPDMILVQHMVQIREKVSVLKKTLVQDEAGEATCTPEKGQSPSIKTVPSVPA
jgi:hypothetical protein